MYSERTIMRWGTAVLLMVGCLNIPVTNSLNLSDFGLDNLSETVLNFDTSAVSLFEWFMKLSDRCRENNVNLSLKSVTSAYACVQKVLNNGTSSESSGDYFDTACQNWDPFMKCVRPVLKQVERCFSGDILNLEGVMSEGLNEIRKPLCKKDAQFFEEIGDGGTEALTCLTKNMEAVVQETVACYTRKSDKSWALCDGFETYKQCFLDGLKICKNAKSEKIVQRILEETGLQNLIYKYVLRCDMDKLKQTENFQKIEL